MLDKITLDGEPVELTPELFRSLAPAERAYVTLDAIDADPSAWRQGSWLTRTPCGTAGCMAGTMCLLAGDRPAWGWGSGSAVVGDVAVVVTVADADPDALIRNVPVSQRAAWLLGFPDYDALWEAGAAVLFDGSINLFDSGNSRDDLGDIVGALFGPRPARLG